MSVMPHFLIVARIAKAISAGMSEHLVCIDGLARFEALDVGLKHLDALFVPIT